MKLMSVIMGYFKFSALCCDSETKFVEYFLIFWGFVNIASISAISVIITVNYKLVFYVNDAVGSMTDILQLLVPIVSHYVIIIESISKRSLGMAIWCKFQDIENDLATFNPKIYQLKLRAMRNYFIKMAVTLAICLFFEFYIIANIKNNREWLNHWYASLFTFEVTRGEHFYFTLMVDKMKHIMNLITLELENVRNGNKFREIIAIKGDSRHKRIVTLKKCYSRLWEISLLMEKRFGWSQFFNVSSNFLCLTVNLYWNFVAIYFKTNPNWKESLMGTCPPLITVFILLYSCEECLKEARVIGYNLHNVERDVNNTELNVAVQQFSMQILLEPVRFSILGFFYMDLALLNSIISAIATYLIIFIQFMPKANIWNSDWKKSQNIENS